KDGFIDKPQARTVRQDPSILAHRAEHAALYLSHLMRALLWLAAFLPRAPLEIKEKENWLRPAWSNVTASLYVADVKYPRPNRKKTSTTEQALLTNQKLEPRVRRPPSETTTLATPLIVYCSSIVSFSGWLHFFLEHH
uniref:GPI mannosyltransferase 2 n=1 Tax=Mesocestoides corti TaxID=53468 RepID=A0A5K3F9I8_MESCO